MNSLVFTPDCGPSHRDKASTKTIQGRVYRRKIKNIHSKQKSGK